VDLACVSGDHVTVVSTGVSVRSVVAATRSESGTIDNVVTPAHVPNAPTGVGATGGNARATVTWTPPVFNGGSPITHYTATADDLTNSANGGQTCTYLVAKPATNSCTVTALTNGDLYTFSVTATNIIGSSKPSTSSIAITPAVPPIPFVFVNPNRLVVDTTKSTSATCSMSIGDMTKCSVTVKAPSGEVIAVGSTTNAGGATSLVVTVRVNANGLKLAEPVGGVLGKVTATITEQSGSTLTATAPLILVRERQTVTISGELFASGSAKISPAGVKQLKALASLVTGAKLAECDGYTDNVGTKKSNLALGLARAKAVCAILKPKVEKIKVVSYGEADPVATNGTSVGRAKNRRVVIKITN
jgi:outer membrane protein OmpA-like peptidoglycan-associated protein